jgi:hypothetical protein
MFQIAYRKTKTSILISRRTENRKKTKLKAMKQITMIRKQKARILQKRIRQFLTGKTTAEVLGEN